MDFLPNELLLSIFSFLELQDFVRVYRVCRKWKGICSSDEAEENVWRPLCLKYRDKMDIPVGPTRELELSTVHCTWGNDKWTRYYKRMLATHYHQWSSLIVVPEYFPDYKLAIVEALCTKTNKRYIREDSVQFLKKAQRITRFYFNIVEFIAPLIMILMMLFLQAKLYSYDSMSWWIVAFPLIALHIIYFIQVAVSFYLRRFHKTLSDYVNGFLGEFLELHREDAITLSIAVCFSMLFVLAVGSNLNQWPKTTSWFACILPHWFGNFAVLVWIGFVSRRSYYKKLQVGQSQRAVLQGELLFMGFFVLIFLIFTIFEFFVCLKVDGNFGTNSWWIALTPLFLISIPLALGSLALFISAIVTKLRKPDAADDMIFAMFCVLFCCGILVLQVLFALRAEGQYESPYWAMFVGLEASFSLISYQVYHSAKSKGEYWEKRVLRLEELKDTSVF